MKTILKEVVFVISPFFENVIWQTRVIAQVLSRVMRKFSLQPLQDEVSQQKSILQSNL